MSIVCRLFRGSRIHCTRSFSSMVTYDTQSNGEVGLITLNNPDKMNALTEEMGDALKNVIDRVSQDHGVRAVIITGAGMP